MQLNSELSSILFVPRVNVLGDVYSININVTTINTVSDKHALDEQDTAAWEGGNYFYDKNV